MRRTAPILGVFALVVALAPTAGATSGTMVITADTTLTEDHDGNIVIDADDVTLDCAGFRVTGQGEGTGIRIVDHTGVTVTTCIVTGHGNGIVLQGVTASTLDANATDENACDGVLLLNSDGNAVIGSRSNDNGCHGFELKSSDDNALRGDTARRVPSGFRIQRSSGNVLVENLVRGSSDGGFIFIHSEGDRVEDNRSLAGGETGFWTQRSSSMTFRGNLAESNAGDGFSLNRSHGIRLVANASVENRVGLILNRCRDTVIKGGRSLRNGESGFVISNRSHDNLLKSNDANANGGDGFDLWGHSSRNSFIANSACRNGGLDAYDDRTGGDNVWRDNDFCTSDV